MSNYFKRQPKEPDFKQQVVDAMKELRPDMEYIDGVLKEKPKTMPVVGQFENDPTELIQDQHLKRELFSLPQLQAKRIPVAHETKKTAVENILGIVSWNDWSPTVSAVSPMTYTSVTVTTARYFILENHVFISIRVTGTTGGTASPNLTFTPPIKPKITDNGVNTLYGYISDTTPQALLCRWVNSSNVFYVSDYNNQNWNLGASKSFAIQGSYEI